MRKSMDCCDEAVSRKTQRPPAEEGAGGDQVASAESKACKGRLCGSCAGGLIADCVAVCCCPCAVLQLLALAFVKLPWTLGSKCLGGGKKGGRRRGRQLENETKCRRGESSECVIERGCTAAGKSRQRPSSASPGPRPAVSGNDRVEVEREWSASHDDQVGHLAFGRVSFGGT